MADLKFHNLGFAVACIPMTDLGQAWAADNLEESTGPIYIEPRYLEDIVQGARDDLLICEGAPA